MKFDLIKEKLKENPERINVLYRWLTEKEFCDSSCEELCKYLLENKSIFDPKLYHGLIRADKNGNRLAYRYGSRQGRTTSEPRKDKDGKIDEKHLAMNIFRQGRKGNEPVKIDQLGYILDYEMPIGGNSKKLKENDGKLCEIYDPDPGSNRSANSLFYNPGKCDLVSYDDKDNCFTILELKKESNKEPLIRAVMEAFTYRELLNQKEAAKSLSKEYPKLRINVDDSVWNAALLLCYGGSQHEEYRKAGKNLQKLMEDLRIKPIWYSYDENSGISIKNDSVVN